MFGISIWQLLIVLVIVVLLFGTKKLKNVGKDVGGAVKGFKDAVKDGQESTKSVEPQGENKVIEGETVKEEAKNDN